jgi:hypothetical protein
MIHTRRTFGTLLPLATLACLLLPPALLAQNVTVGQGEIGRWAGEDTTGCGMDGKTFAPVDGVCYFPVDMARSPGRVEIARWHTGGVETAWLDVAEREFELQNIEFPDESYVHLSEENLARLYQEQAEIKPLFRRSGGAPTFSLPLGPPLDPMVEGRYFGVHRTFNGEPKSRHTGTDYAVGLGNAVQAVADGEVVLTGEHFFAGRSVYVLHGNGLVSMYFHLDSIDVEKGQEVKKGDTVGKVGSTGRSTGPHLHLGVRWRGSRVDPGLLLGDPAALPAVTP